MVVVDDPGRVLDGVEAPDTEEVLVGVEGLAEDEERELEVMNSVVG